MFIHFISSSSWSTIPTYLELLNYLITFSTDGSPVQNTLLTSSSLSMCSPLRPVHSINDINGQAILYSSRGDDYAGECINGKPSGKGVLHYANGCWHEGSWSEGRREGHGVYKYSDRVWMEGEWEADRLVKKEGLRVEGAEVRKPELFDDATGSLPFLEKEEEVLRWRWEEQ